MRPRFDPPFEGLFGELARWSLASELCIAPAQKVERVCVSPSFDRVDAEVIRAKRVFMASKNTILAARDDLDRHQQWLERFTAQAASPVSKSIEQRTQRGRISSGEPFRVVPTIGSLVISTLGVFGISLLVAAVIWRTKSHVRDVPPVPVAPTAFVGQTVAKTPPRIRESVALPVRGSEAPPVAEDTLHAKPKAKIKSKRKVSRDESQFLGW